MMRWPLPLLAIPLLVIACGRAAPSDPPDPGTASDMPAEMGSDADIPVDATPDLPVDAPADLSDMGEDASPDLVEGPYTLVVEDGYGSGTYMAGEEVHVFAGNDPWSSVVTGWEGAQGAEWHFVFTMPARDATLRPQTQPALMELQTTEVPNAQGGTTRVLWAAPPEPRGLIYFFHGTGGSANVLGRYGMNGVARAAWARGYVVAAPDAHERTLEDPGADGNIRWDAVPNLATNRDLQNLEAITPRLLRRTQQATDAPVYAVGMSNGGAFAITAGQALGLRAVASYCSAGREAAFSATTTPTQWLMCGQDSNAQVAGRRGEWRAGTTSLTTRDVPTDYDEHPPSPMFPGRFARLPGVDAETSAAAVEEMRAQGVLDEDGFLLRSPAEFAQEVQGSIESWPSLRAVILASSAAEVSSVLRHAWADHMMYDDWAARTLDFFEAAP